MPLRYPVVALAVAALAVAACGTPPAAAPALPPVTPIMIPPALAANDGDALVGRVWAWQRTQFSDGKVVVPDAAERYTLEFQADGRVQLRADCNHGGARFDAGAGRTLTLSPAAITKMGCPAGSQGSEFLHELSQVAAYLFASGNLVLTLRADAGSMHFAPAAKRTATVSGRAAGYRAPEAGR